MSDEESCAFCEIIAGRLAATIVGSDAQCVAFLDVRQFHSGHVLVVPRAHIADIRSADEKVAAAVIVMVARIARALDAAFPSDGLSVWHSAGPGANQEVQHLHFHIHPRRIGDGVLRVYPESPPQPSRSTLQALGARLRDALAGVPVAAT